MINELGLKLYEVHGCAFGCTDPEGNRVHKPWIIATNDPHPGEIVGQVPVQRGPQAPG